MRGQKILVEHKDDESWRNVEAKMKRSLLAGCLSSLLHGRLFWSYLNILTTWQLISPRMRKRKSKEEAAEILMS